MDIEALDDALWDSIEDRHVSRKERKQLRRLIREQATDLHRATRIRGRAFAVARSALERQKDQTVLEWLEDVIGLLAHHAQSDRPTGVECQAHFSPGTDCMDAVVGELRAVRRHADICVFTITDDRITKAIIAAARRGVRVRVISDDEKSGDKGSDLDELARSRVDVTVDRSSAHMHHKFAVFDNRRLVTGSFNWTRSASRGNHENLLVTTESRLVRAYSEEFERLWEEFT